METLGLLLQNEACRIHCDPQTKSPLSKRVYVIENEGFCLGDEIGPAEESKWTKRVQGWSRQIGLGALFAIHVNCFQYNVCGLCRCEPSNH